MTALIHAHKLHAGTDAAKLFFKELMENVETLTGIADRYGPRTLADVMYLQNAILDGSFIELFPDESAVLDIVDELPSAAIWRKFVQTVASATTALRRDVPNEILEMLLFEGEPKGRSREDLEARFTAAAGIPYIARWLGVPESEETPQPAVSAKVEGNTTDPLAGNPKVEVLTNLGYDIDEDGDQPGLWIWTSPSDGCDISYASAQEAADAAWTDAIGQTMGILNLSSEQWDALSLAQQLELVSDTLSGD